MAVSGWQLLSLALLVACMSSFVWAIRNFFVQPAGLTASMRVTAIAGTSFALLHAFAILRAADLTARRGLLGTLLYATSLGLFWWAVVTNRKTPLSAVFSPDVPLHLVQGGPYRLMRHPFYCSYLLAWTGGFAVTRTWWIGVSVLAMFALYLYAAVLEERKFSRSGMAERYCEYRARTGRFVPNLFKLAGYRRSQ